MGCGHCASCETFPIDTGGKSATEHKYNMEYMPVPLPCEPAKDRDHWFHVHLLLCRLPVNKDLNACEKGQNHVNLDIVIFSLRNPYHLKSNYRQRD